MENKQKINARIVADSVDSRGNRITTFILTYPRIIHAEVMTHRLFSRNAASSRAIPFNKMVKSIEEDPFIPIAWQKDHKGMQGTEYWTKDDILTPIPDKTFEIDAITHFRNEWLAARDYAVLCARGMHETLGITKQLCNRLLEPFQWYTCLVTTTEFDNFFELRLPKYKLIGLGGDPAKSRKDWLKKMQFSSALHPSQYPKTEEEWWTLSESGAEIHIQALAEAMWDARNESVPKELKAGQWHIPFGDRMDTNELHNFGIVECDNVYDIDHLKLYVATARCARLSYMTFDGEIDYEKDIKLHDQLLTSGHMSPFEHCSRCMGDEEYYWYVKGKDLTEGYDELAFDKNSYGWCNNFKGFISYRYLLENEQRTI